MGVTCCISIRTRNLKMSIWINMPIVKLRSQVCSRHQFAVMVLTSNFHSNQTIMIMKKNYMVYLLPVLMLLAVSSCNKSFQEATINKNVPATVAASLLFNGVLNDFPDLPDGAYASNYQSSVVYKNTSNKDEIWCQYY